MNAECLFMGGVSVRRCGGNDEKINDVIVDFCAGGLL